MAIQLSPDDLARLRDKQLANAIRKLGEGKTLTAREDALLAQAGVGSTAAAPSGFCKTWDQLAERLGVSLRALKDWRNRADLQPHLPKNSKGEHHDVAAWARFMVEHGLARADETAPLTGSAGLRTGTFADSPPNTIRDWKARLEELKCQRLEQKIRVEAGELTVTADVEIALGQLLIAFRASLDHLAPSAARWVRGLTDFHAIVERLQAECDGVLHGLYRADYLGDILPAIVAAQPPPEGIAAETWNTAVTAAVQNALRAVGRLALPDETTDATPTPTATAAQSPAPALAEITTPAAACVAGADSPSVGKVGTSAKRRKPAAKRKSAKRQPRSARPRDVEAAAHAALKPTFAEETRRKRGRRH